MAIVKYIHYDYKKSARPKYSDVDLCQPDMSLSVKQILDRCIRTGAPIPFDTSTKYYDPVIDQNDDFPVDAPIQEIGRDLIDQANYELLGEARIERLKSESNDTVKQQNDEQNDAKQNDAKNDAVE